MLSRVGQAIDAVFLLFARLILGVLKLPFRLLARLFRRGSRRQDESTGGDQSGSSPFYYGSFLDNDARQELNSRRNKSSGGILARLRRKKPAEGRSSRSPSITGRDSRLSPSGRGATSKQDKPRGGVLARLRRKKPQQDTSYSSTFTYGRDSHSSRQSGSRKQDKPRGGVLARLRRKKPAEGRLSPSPSITGRDSRLSPSRSGVEVKQDKPRRSIAARLGRKKEAQEEHAEPVSTFTRPLFGESAFGQTVFGDQTEETQRELDELFGGWQTPSTQESTEVDLSDEFPGSSSVIGQSPFKQLTDTSSAGDSLAGWQTRSPARQQSPPYARPDQTSRTDFDRRLKAAEEKRSRPKTAKRRRLRLRLRTGGDPLRYRLYFHLHPRRILHGFARLGTRLRGRGVWESKDRPGLELVPKAIKWARQYRRHGSRFRDIETLRADLIADRTIVADLPGKPTVGGIVRHNGTRPRWGALLNGLVFHTHTQRVFELGTDVGIAGMYLARGLLDIYPMRTCALFTLDENAQTLNIARDNFRKLGFEDIVHIYEGPFREQVPEALEKAKPLDLAYIDGRHDTAETLRHFMRIRANSRDGTLIVLTHIHRSPAMFRAWQGIRGTRRVAATVDLWHWGIVVVGNGPALHLSARL